MNIISAQNKEIALWCKQYALEQGADAVRIVLVASTNNSFEFRNEQLENLESSTENGLNIELFVDQKYGNFSSNRLEKEELKTFIQQGIASVRYLAKDQYRQLPSPERYYTDKIDLELVDQQYFNIPTDKKLNIAKKASEEILNSHPDIISISSSYADSISSVYIADSNGFEAQTDKTTYSLMVSVSLKTSSDARAEDFWYDVATHWDELQKEGIGKKALSRALERVGQGKIASGKYTMLLDNMSASRLLSPIISAMSGGAIQQRNSFLLDKLDQKLFSEKLTIVDRPHQKGKIGSRLYDGEGVATSERIIIDKGQLKTYFIDTYNSAKLGMPPTIASSSGLCLQLGNKTHEQLIEEINKGIWVTGFNGGNTNSSTGDFSFGVEGFLIEDGKVTKPISEMNITGNLLTLWTKIVEIGNNPRKNISSQIPSIVFDDVSFSGL